MTRYPGRALAMKLIAALAFLGVSVSMCNFTEKGAPGVSQPLPD